MSWHDWWLWAAAALILAIVEVLAPSWIFLGFAIGAGAMALLLAFGGPAATVFTGSLPLMLVVYAVVSLVAWVGLRRAMGVRKNQVKTFDHDINE